VQDEQWDEIAEDLRKRGAGGLVEAIPRTLVEAATEQDLDHPLARLFCERDSASVRLTSNAVAQISRHLETDAGKHLRPWWESRLKLLVGDSAAGTLAEIRALGVALPTDSTIGHGLRIQPHSASGRASDFRIASETGDVFLEVCCARMNKEEEARLEWIDSVESEMLQLAKNAAVEKLGLNPGATTNATAVLDGKDVGARHGRHDVSVSAMRRPDGGSLVMAVTTRSKRPYGAPGERGDADTLASKLSRKKPPGQIPGANAGILWMDLADPDWEMSVKDTLPVEVFRKGLNLATTRGVWHSFYGRADTTPLLERHAVAFDFGGTLVKRLSSNGRFRDDEQRCWSAAVLRCTNGIVIFEHPDPEVLLPMPILRELTDLDGYAPYASIHRFDEDRQAVARRIEEIDKMLAFYAA
jgi:hypothetical protein